MSTVDRLGLGPMMLHALWGYRVRAHAMASSRPTSGWRLAAMARRRRRPNRFFLLLVSCLRLLALIEVGGTSLLLDYRF
jgi:hypothetical protein